MDSASSFQHMPDPYKAAKAGREVEYTLPEGMTAEKLRQIAYWFDLHDQMAGIFLTLLAKSDELGTLAAKARDSVEGKELQDDLRRWAELIDDRREAK